MSNTYALDVPYNFPVRPAFPSGNPAASEELLRQKQAQANASLVDERASRARTAYAQLPIMRPTELMTRKRRTLEYDRVWQDRVPLQQKADALLLASRPVFAEWGERERQLRTDAFIMPPSQVARQAGLDIRRLNDPLAMSSSTSHVDRVLKVHYSTPAALSKMDDTLKTTTTPIQFGQAQLVYLNPDDSTEAGAVFGRFGHTIPFTRSAGAQQFFTPVLGTNGQRDPYIRAAQSTLFRPYVHYAQ